MRRIRLDLAYDGTDFHGWQVQPGARTIQQELQDILSAIDGKPVLVAGSGRTDAGVHARGQVAAFTLENQIPAANLQKAVNRLLPRSIRVMAVTEAAPDFHPRFDAIAKTYEYRIYRGEVCDPFLWRYVHHHPYPLDTAVMAAMAPLLEGEHDFTAFSTTDPQWTPGKSKVRRVFASKLDVSPEWLIYRVRGSGFLKHMVRNMVGFLIETGKGNATAATLSDMLTPGSKLKAGTRAPAKGLTLVSVEYPSAPHSQSFD